MLGTPTLPSCMKRPNNEHPMLNKDTGQARKAKVLVLRRLVELSPWTSQQHVNDQLVVCEHTLDRKLVHEGNKFGRATIRAQSMLRWLHLRAVHALPVYDWTLAATLEYDHAHIIRSEVYEGRGEIKPLGSKRVHAPTRHVPCCRCSSRIGRSYRR